MRTVLASLGFCLVAALALAHHGPATITINAAAKKQPPVPFNHEKHSMTLVKSCDTCHHTQKGLTAEKAKDTKVAKCSSCHLDPKPPVPSMREMSLTKNPFHIGCIACHKEQKKGPTACTACHKRG
ncbi:MAG: cytochrome c3 family protein [Thermoanaerobaculia bacterium]